MKKIQDFLKNMKLRNKIVAGFILLALISVFSVCIISYKFSTDLLHEKTLIQAQETIQLLSMNMENNIRLINDRLATLAYDQQLQEQLRLADVEVSGTVTNAIQRQMSRIMVMSYYSTTLYDIEVYGHNGCDFRISQDDFKKYQLEDIYVEAAEAANGKLVMVNNEPEEGCIQIVKEINDTTNLASLGILRAAYKKSFLKSIIKEINFAAEGEVLLLDDSNQLIIGAENYFVGREKELFSDYTGNFEFNMDKGRYIIVYDRSQYTNWTSIGIISVEALQSDAFPIEAIGIVVAVVLVFFCFLLARLLTASVVHPVDKMVGALRAFSGGDFSVRLPEDRKDEMGLLSKGFNQMIVKIDTLIDNVYRSELLKKESEFKALQAQINPHFLYNTLETINWMARKNGMHDICKMVVAVGDLMRISISNKKSFITVREEVKYVEEYLYIQKVRYRDKLNMEVDVAKEILEQKIPKLILQPIVENAVIHGIENSKNPGRVVVIGRLFNGRLVFVIRDTGVGMSQEKIRSILENTSDTESSKHTSLGVYTVYQRLKYIYGDACDFLIESEEGKFTRVIIRFPAQ